MDVHSVGHRGTLYSLAPGRRSRGAGTLVQNSWIDAFRHDHRAHRPRHVELQIYSLSNEQIMMYYLKHAQVQKQPVSSLQRHSDLGHVVSHPQSRMLIREYNSKDAIVHVMRSVYKGKML